MASNCLGLGKAVEALPGAGFAVADDRHGRVLGEIGKIGVQPPEHLVHILFFAGQIDPARFGRELVWPLSSCAGERPGRGPGSW